jgi:hypothetical protein
MSNFSRQGQQTVTEIAQSDLRRYGCTEAAHYYAEHGLVDEKGRKVGGRAVVWKNNGDGLFYVMLYATRDGVLFGASPTKYYYRVMPEIGSAREGALAILAAQGKRYARQADAQAAKVAASALSRSANL